MDQRQDHYYTPEHRYLHDATFRQMVDQLEYLLHTVKTTPTEIREACMLALIHYEERKVRKYTVTQEQYESMQSAMIHEEE